MTFLSPSALWLLGVISIPIIIHLLSKLQLRKVEFSTIRFIKELKTSSIRKVQIKKIILLIIRVLCIASLVLMMAQPVTKGFFPGWLSADQETILAVVIDNSASMSTQDGGKTFLEKSKSALMRLIPIFKNQTNIIITQTCPPKIIFSGLSSDPELRNSVKMIAPTASYDNIWTTLHTLINNNNKEPIKECLVFSDLMHAPDSSILKNINNIEEWRFYFIQPNDVYDNLGIVNVSPVNRIKTMHQLVKLNARVVNSGILEKPNIPLELLFNLDRVGQVVSEFEKNKEKEFLFQAYPPEIGIIEGKIVLPKDDYIFDNIWNLSLPIMDEIRCSIIGSNKNDIDLLEKIFKSIDPENKFIEIESKIYPDMERLFLDDTDVLVLHNPLRLNNETVKDIKKFLTNGGGLIWFQGNQQNRDYNSALFEELDFPSLDTLIGSEQGFFSTNIISEKSDLLNDIQVRSLKNELPEVFKYVKTKINSKHKIHWQLNNNDPLLIEFSKGTGTVFYFSTLLNLNWSDLPIRGMIVPLLYRMIILIGTDEINTAPVLVDESKWISIEESELRNKWEVVSPSGRIEMIAPEFDLEGINIVNTNELGIYQVYNNGEKFTSFPTRLHYKEYIDKRINKNNIEMMIGKNNSRWLTIDDNLQNVFSKIRNGESLWRIFLLFAIIFMLIETIIGRPKTNEIKN